MSAIQNRTFIGGVMRYAIATLRADYDPTYAVKNVVERPEIEHARPMEKYEAVQLRNKLNSYGGSTTVKNAGLVMLYYAQDYRDPPHGNMLILKLEQLHSQKR